MNNKFLHIPQVVKWLGVNTKLMVDPIIVHFSQGIVRPSLSVATNVKLFCRWLQFFENFALCDLDSFDVILGNTFMDAYKVDILRIGSKVKFCAKNNSILVNLNA
jgi:hypothetical protein